MMMDLNINKLKFPPSPPLPNYIFRVTFGSSKGDGTTNEGGYLLDNDNDPSMIAYSVTLPTFDTKIVTKKFLGTEKSFPVYRSNAGETTLEFYTHSDQWENDFIVVNFFKDIEDKISKQYYHDENYSYFDYINIYLCDITTRNVVYIYKLENCIVTKIDQGSLSYESSEAIKYSMTVHYDNWYIQDTRPDEVDSKD